MILTESMLCPSAVSFRRALTQTDPLAAYAAVDCNVTLSVGLDSFSTGLSASAATGAATLAQKLASYKIEVSPATSTNTQLGEVGTKWASNVL